MRSYLSLIWKDSVTCTHDLVVYVKEGLPFLHDCSLKNLDDSYLFFQLALLISSFFCFLHQQPSSSLCTVTDPIFTNIDKVLTDVKGLKVHNKNWFYYSGEYELLPCVTFLRLFSLKLRSLTRILAVVLFQTFFELLILTFVVQWYFLHCRLVIVLSRFPLMLVLSHKNSIFIVEPLVILVSIDMAFMIISEMFHKGYIWSG